MAIKFIKKNKAPGVDERPPITFKLFNNHPIQFMTFLFNKLLEEEVYPEAWCTGLIKPIHKKGSKKDLSNYRGITLLPIMGKLFTGILADRVSLWADLNGKLNEAQFEFRKNRTTDAILILFTAIQAFKKKKQLYTCFVDFAKAFDSINHYFLWNKMSSMGLSRKMLTIFQKMCSKATARITSNNKLSNIFQCKKV